MRGFFASAVLISAIFLISGELAAYQIFCSQAGETRNVLLLRQMINEKIYGIEDGFRFTVHEALRQTTGNGKADSVLVCNAIDAWTKELEKENISASMIFAGESDEQISLDACAFFVKVRDKTAVVGYNGLYKITPWDYGVLSFDRISFVFRASVGNVNVTAFIPAGTVIE